MAKMESTPDIRIIFEDNHLLVAYKPPGVLSQDDGRGRPDMLSLLKKDLKIRYQKPGNVYLGLVHRLDMPVGGVMVFARTSKAAARLSEQVRQRQMAKYYLAVVKGNPEPRAGELRDYLVKDRMKNIVSITDSGNGRESWLSYVRLEYNHEHNCALAGIKLGSGRPHQIRVQMAGRGWPLLGDRRYGEPGKGEADIALFAAGLGFFHPVSHEYLLFGALPPDVYPWNYFACPDAAAIAGLFEEE